jgi:hypothetical protein
MAAFPAWFYIYMEREWAKRGSLPLNCRCDVTIMKVWSYEPRLVACGYRPEWEIQRLLESHFWGWRYRVKKVLVGQALRTCMSVLREWKYCVPDMWWLRNINISLVRLCGNWKLTIRWRVTACLNRGRSETYSVLIWLPFPPVLCTFNKPPKVSYTVSSSLWSYFFISI